jgi:hypothetical protein
MHDEILDCAPQGLFSEQDQAIQTGLLYAEVGSIAKLRRGRLVR